MPRALPILLLLLPALATAAKVRERWGFAWDAHPQAAQVGYFELDIKLPGKLIRDWNPRLSLKPPYPGGRHE